MKEINELHDLYSPPIMIYNKEDVMVRASFTDKRDEKCM
jgi:hypothetical protein